MNYTLTMFNTWQITLPKKRRSKYNTKHFTATEVEGGILIKPVYDDMNDTVYYENKDGFGIYSEKWIDPDTIIDSIKALHKHG